MYEIVLQGIEAERVKHATVALSRGPSEDRTLFEYGHACGVETGLKLALDVIKGILDREDQKGQNL